MVDIFIRLKYKRNRSIFRMVIILFIIVVISYLIISQNKSNKYVESLLIDGSVNKICRISGEKGTYILIDNNWFFTLGYGLCDSIKLNDKVVKEKGENINLYRKNIDGQIEMIINENVFISEVADDVILKKLSLMNDK